ncbi:phosphoribosylamine--glycine ligase [Candidatus Pelagibacter sp. HIMB1782]|uniref:phosphoribosylamine--glycine ligase n=1 Tax=Candidatus Pelagibacter sp. HIMB1782 TaxID=3413375 RepID=UPI003F846C40
MRIGIIGSGGREHAICASIKKSKKIEKIYCFPGNAGTDKIAENVSIDLNNFEIIKNFIHENNIELIIVGPEKPLVDGLVDYLEKYKIKVFGPNKLASQLEGSKIFTKKLCEKFKIPTAKFGIFENIESSKKFLNEVTFPTVIKADNLASGKGVYICNSLSEAMLAVEEIFNGKFGPTKNLLIEEFLDGEEMSFFVVCDGKSFKTFDTAQDHKRVLEGDKGKNTGGMGAYSPSRLITKELENKVIDRIINPTLKGLEEIGTNYKGFLYAGLMIVKNEPYLIEYNVRMGDPECQTILPKLKTDLFDVIIAATDGKLDNLKIEWEDLKSLCVVVCSKGYPDEFKKNIELENIKNVYENKHNYLFHAGTKKENNSVYATGGRVLNFVSTSNDFSEARKNIFENINKLNWSNGYYRRDIGYKVIK